MKRLIFILTILLVAVTGASAQSLSGTWSATISDSESDQSDGVSTDMKMTGQDILIFSGSSFTRNASCIVTLNAASQETAMDMTIKVNGSASGTWVLEGDTLTLTPDKKVKPNLTVESKNCPALIETMIVGPLQKELKNSLKEVESMKIISYDDTHFTVNDDGETITYSKVK